MNAQAHADSNGVDALVVWRGYRTTVKPNQPKFTGDDLDNALEVAIDFIDKGNDAIIPSEHVEVVQEEESELDLGKRPLSKLSKKNLLKIKVHKYIMLILIIMIINLK